MRRFSESVLVGGINPTHHPAAPQLGSRSRIVRGGRSTISKGFVRIVRPASRAMPGRRGC